MSGPRRCPLDDRYRAAMLEASCEVSRHGLAAVAAFARDLQVVAPRPPIGLSDAAGECDQHAASPAKNEGGEE